MTWPFGERAASLNAAQLIAERTGKRFSRKAVSREDAMSHSAVWAALRLRADLLSSMPTDVFRRVQGVQVEMPKPRVMVYPGGPQSFPGEQVLRWKEWVYSSQVDLDSSGNHVSIITERDANGLPAAMESVNIEDVTFKGKGSKLTEVKVGRKSYTPREVWHERQYTLSGLAIGLSPIAYAAMSIRGYLSAQEFANDWFDNSAVPAAHLKNTKAQLDQSTAAVVKQNFKASLKSGDVWVSGNDWEYSVIAAKASESAFIEQQQFSITDVARYLGVPGDVIDAAVSGQAVTYANISQRNLQLLIMNLGPAIDRREDAWSAGLLPQPRYVKMNTSALLRMDNKTRMETHKVAIDSRIYPPSRALELENMPPLTPDEVAEFATLFPARAAATGGTP